MLSATFLTYQSLRAFGVDADVLADFFVDFTLGVD